MGQLTCPPNLCTTISALPQIAAVASGTELVLVYDPALGCTGGLKLKKPGNASTGTVVTSVVKDLAVDAAFAPGGNVSTVAGVVTVRDALTSMTYNPINKALSYLNENGEVSTADLSALAIDMTVTGAAYSLATGILTLSESNGGPTVAVDLSALKAVNTAMSIAGNGDGTALTLVNDAVTPGNNFYYGTNAFGVKGWYISPKRHTAFVTQPLAAGINIITHNLALSAGRGIVQVRDAVTGAETLVRATNWTANSYTITVPVAMTSQDITFVGVE